MVSSREGDSMTEVFRWGILGTGGIAKDFADGLAELPDARLHAVAARKRASAQAFAQSRADKGQHPQVCDDYAAVIQHPEVDVVYIATTHHNHVALARQAIAAGKAVLVEKPVGLHGDEVATMVAEAQASGVFLMEAMWTRFMPAIQALQHALAEDVLGPVRLVQADFGIDLPHIDAQHRMLDPALGGGALWDLGIYPLTFSRLIFGCDPHHIQSIMIPAPETGVDELSAILARFGDGGVAQLMCGFRLRVPHQARIYGPKGRIVVDDFFHPQAFTIEPHEGEARTENYPFTGPGYQFEAAEVQRCLRAGLQESSVCPLQETLALIRIMDQLVQQWGIIYPRGAL
ncbi:MAG: gfo/Idh/MocA family oxidoreductase [Planctomycetota bacterium]|nr:MAG: gfo/Idh/MocA family oxidoreductase [Planctomycetota bacterium]